MAKRYRLTEDVHIFATRTPLYALEPDTHSALASRRLATTHRQRDPTRDEQEQRDPERDSRVGAGVTQLRDLLGRVGALRRRHRIRDLGLVVRVDVERHLHTLAGPAVVAAGLGVGPVGVGDPSRPALRCCHLERVGAVSRTRPRDRSRERKVRHHVGLRGVVGVDERHGQRVVAVRDEACRQVHVVVQPRHVTDALCLDVSRNQRAIAHLLVGNLLGRDDRVTVLLVLDGAGNPLLQVLIPHRVDPPVGHGLLDGVHAADRGGAHDVSTFLRLGGLRKSGLVDRAVVRAECRDDTLRVHTRSERVADGVNMCRRELLEPLVGRTVVGRTRSTGVQRGCILDVLGRLVAEPEVLAVDALDHEKAVTGDDDPVAGRQRQGVVRRVTVEVDQELTTGRVRERSRVEVDVLDSAGVGSCTQILQVEVHRVVGRSLARVRRAGRVVLRSHEQAIGHELVVACRTRPAGCPAFQ